MTGVKIKHQTWNKPRCDVFKTTYEKQHAAQENTVRANMKNETGKANAAVAGTAPDATVQPRANENPAQQADSDSSAQPVQPAVALPAPQRGMKTGQKARCVECKGRLWCGLQSCPLLDRVAIQKPLEAKLGKEVFGPSPPNIFAGWQGYPQVFAGPLVSYHEEESAAASDNPQDWYGYNFSKIIEMRASLVRGMQKTHVRQKDRFVSDLQDIVMSVKTVDLEVAFKTVPRFSMSFSPVSQPMGPSATLDDMRLVDNPKIPRKIDSVAQENITVRDALPELMGRDFDYYYLQKLLTAGILGKKDARRIVPTRWSITATDRIVADFHIQRLKELPELGEIRGYSNEYLYNHFEILLLPGKWEFEQFESWAPGTIWTQEDQAPHIAHEYEPFGGRSDYAESEGGGYYAGRFSVAEALATTARSGCGRSAPRCKTRFQSRRRNSELCRRRWNT